VCVCVCVCVWKEVAEDEAGVCVCVSVCVCVCISVCVCERWGRGRRVSQRMRTRKCVSEGAFVHECVVQHACSSAQETDNGAAVALNVLGRRKLGCWHLNYWHLKHTHLNKIHTRTNTHKNTRTHYHPHAHTLAGASMPELLSLRAPGAAVNGEPSSFAAP
jgi:hypothetical protein